ncbi:hypothetical protein LOK49_LG13G00093 [Camellia lanceoleosa]|uniref:Uncharacterized protein n=1 Tax=Camellia lanceoleosa TaxID=1840588 RepID=A0ACC0FHQ1_9ERIC|nr:hypothetical protein LOK49_LG13G00093 [Camellia lanceoleosa]
MRTKKCKVFSNLIEGMFEKVPSSQKSFYVYMRTWMRTRTKKYVWPWPWKSLFLKLKLQCLGKIGIPHQRLENYVCHCKKNHRQCREIIHILEQQWSMHGKVEELRALTSKEFLDSFTEDENKEV